MLLARGNPHADHIGARPYFLGLATVVEYASGLDSSVAFQASALSTRNSSQIPNKEEILCLMSAGDEHHGPPSRRERE